MSKISNQDSLEIKHYVTGLSLIFPEVSRYLNYGTSYVCFQELKRIPNHKDQGTDHKDRGAKCTQRWRW